MNNTKVVAGILIALAIITTGYVLVSNHQAAPSKNVGAISSPDLPWTYLSWGGMATFRNQSAMRGATTTLCAIQSPAATTTLAFAGYTITVGTSTASNLDLATSTSAFATTSAVLISNTSVASNAQASQSWFSSGTNSIIAPNTWVIVQAGNVGLGGYTYVGSCDAEFNDL